MRKRNLTGIVTVKGNKYEKPKTIIFMSIFQKL